jgi:ubiquinone/menaquinone biosynthesis C-methylase UbiE
MQQTNSVGVRFIFLLLEDSMITRRLLEDAGLRAGMQVLDVGCGPGDVSLLAAELVGEQGSVIGVDSNASVLQIAQARAQAAGLRPVSFLVGTIDELALTQQFDAIVGRLILMYMPQPAAVLRQLSTHLRPGGVLPTGCATSVVRRISGRK